jgi:hypothetical protein
MALTRVGETPYYKLNRLTEEVNLAIEGTQDTWEKRELPSPSAIEQCTRRTWFVAHDTPVTERVPSSSILAMDSGKALEDMAFTMLNAAGYTTLATQVVIEPSYIACKGGTADWVGTDPSGKLIVLDVKRLGLYGYKDMVIQGTRKAKVQYYTQLQLYMHALGIYDAQIMCLSADHSALKGWWRQRKYDMDKLPPPVWMEELKYDPQWVERSIQRAIKITEYLQMENPKYVPRDYDPFTKRYWQCDYCGYREACKKAG